ncbi:MAG: hypothetical protein QM222_05840 [Bacillota bacterium]|jgi:hypothetical protein|nr:hypothetical protein [Bacillota bacterium]
MKLKYKKIILLTSLATMCIGLLTISISQSGQKNQEKSSSISASAETGDIESDNTNSRILAMASLTSASEDNTATGTPTPSPTPTPIPVYDLEEIEDMNKFFEEYYMAKAACDVDKLKTLYKDPSKVETREQLQNMVQYIEEYKNIKTYAKKSIEEGAYIVYAYHEIKFTSINTLAPGLSKFYVVTDDEGNYKIASDINPEIEEYFHARNEDEDVLKLIEKTNSKSEKVKEKDEDLMIFWNALDELAKKTEDQS